MTFTPGTPVPDATPDKLMHRVIWRHKIAPGTVTTAPVGHNARVVHAGADLSGDISVWVEHSVHADGTVPNLPDGEKAFMALTVVMTGETIPAAAVHLGTALLRTPLGGLVVHAYRLTAHPMDTAPV